MKSKFIIALVVSLCLVGTFMYYQTNVWENKSLLEEKRQEVIGLLQENLEKFNPALSSFVDENYKTVIASTISSDGICEFERGLAKNESPLGTYTIEYDLNNMMILAEEIEITNPKFSEDWRTFKISY